MARRAAERNCFNQYNSGWLSSRCTTSAAILCSVMGMEEFRLYLSGQKCKVASDEKERIERPSLVWLALDIRTSYRAFGYVRMRSLRIGAPPCYM